jgi:SAM-dependent methyltransferase
MPVPQSMFESRTWSLVAPGYAAEITSTFGRFAEDALALGRLAPGERVLDVATGPGTLALPAAREGARVSAIDFSPRMIDELRARARRAGLAEIDARVADATALPYEDGAFDAVFSMFALNLMADRRAAFREIHRVLRRGGRVVVGTPTSLARAPAFEEIRDIVRRAIPQLELDVDFPLAQPDELRAEMAAARFADVDVRQVTRSFAYPSVGAIWAIANRAGAPIVLARSTMAEGEWARASEAIVGELQGRFGSGPQTIDLSVNLADARKERGAVS